MMDIKAVEKLLTQVKAGNIGVDEAVDKLKKLPFEDLGFAKIDHHRQIRCSHTEVVYCPGKTDQEISAVFQSLADNGGNVLATRATQSNYDYLIEHSNCKKAQYYSKAMAIVLQQHKIEDPKEGIVIVSAGTADGSVAAEAEITAKMMGHKPKLLCDVGVAGLHRLLGNIDILQKANVIVVVAGMDGALASVVGGVVSCPVIAVPTSVGYGTAFGGLSAILTMLNSCAAGVSVVNIDNGFGGGYTASLINEKIWSAKK